MIERRRLLKKNKGTVTISAENDLLECVASVTGNSSKNLLNIPEKGKASVTIDLPVFVNSITITNTDRIKNKYGMLYVTVNNKPHITQQFSINAGFGSQTFLINLDFTKGINNIYIHIY